LRRTARLMVRESNWLAVSSFALFRLVAFELRMSDATLEVHRAAVNAALVSEVDVLDRSDAMNFLLSDTPVDPGLCLARVWSKLPLKPIFAQCRHKCTPGAVLCKTHASKANKEIRCLCDGLRWVRAEFFVCGFCNLSAINTLVLSCRVFPLGKHDLRVVVVAFGFIRFWDLAALAC
jgi:hypothetical protein